MEVDEIQCNNFPQMNNNNNDVEEEARNNDNNQQLATTAVDRFYGGWPSSRIVRVSRASGGKDRHSKVLTSKGLRDRRVRLSVNTAIQFYDLQDRLGYDQPSKAVEWLLKAAATSIAELPQICAPFGDNNNNNNKLLLLQVGGGTGGSDDNNNNNNNKRSMSNGDGSSDHHLGFDRADGTDGAAVSSNSETSKGSAGLSLSRSQNRIKARERAKGRVAENNGISKFRLQEKEKENESLNPNISQTTSFTELLSGTGATTNHDLSRPWSSTPMDYFTTGLLTPPPQFSTVQQGGDQNYPFVPENLNFTISSSVNNSSGLAGYNRGTLQSNSSFHRFSAINNNNDGSSSSFLMENQNQNQQQQQHQFFSGFDGRLHLCYGDAVNANNGNRGGKGKN